MKIKSCAISSLRIPQEISLASLLKLRIVPFLLVCSQMFENTQPSQPFVFISTDNEVHVESSFIHVEVYKISNGIFKHALSAHGHPWQISTKMKLPLALPEPRKSRSGPILQTHLTMLASEGLPSRRTN